MNKFPPMPTNPRDRPTEADIRQMAEPLCEMLYHYWHTATPVLLRMIVEYEDKKDNDNIAAAKREAKREAKRIT